MLHLCAFNAHGKVAIPLINRQNLAIYQWNGVNSKQSWLWYILKNKMVIKYI
jgi:hypothetical protein